MTEVEELWRRESSLAPPMLGATRRRDGVDWLLETNPGRVALSAVFVRQSHGRRRTRFRGPARLTIQVRTGVALLERYRLGGSSGPVSSRVLRDNIAIGAAGGLGDHRYTWVQIVATDPETVTPFSGPEYVYDVPRGEEREIPGNTFRWQHRDWHVDQVRTSSAEYLTAGHDLLPAAGPNGLIIYDAPTGTMGMTSWMRDHPSAQRIRRTVRFHSFLYELPFEEPPYLPGVTPIASVAWHKEELFERERPTASPRRVGSRYDATFIVPNPTIPAGMISVLWRVFHGR